MNNPHPADIPTFNPNSFGTDHQFARIGAGEIGAKASGLLSLHEDFLPRLKELQSDSLKIEVPGFVVIASEVFVQFMERNRLWDLVNEGTSDSQIARAFQEGELPGEFRDELRKVVAVLKTPLAVRPSSVLEASGDFNFAGIYSTKIIPNAEDNPNSRYRSLAAAVKLVWASTFSRGAVIARRAAGETSESERMAVLIQEVFGTRHGSRFYPTCSGIVRSYNYYPCLGSVPSDGAISLALGLGKTIVDGGYVWSACPARPLAPPPFKNTKDLLNHTQTTFWAVDLDGPATPNPTSPGECLERAGLGDAEADGALKFLVSTYDAGSDRLESGLSARGPRALTFAPLLGSRSFPFNDFVNRLLETSREAVGGEAEIEFSAVIDSERGIPMRIGLLQQRPLAASDEQFTVQAEDLTADGLVVASDNALGNGCRTDLEDIVYLRPDNFDRNSTPAMINEIEAVNRGLVEQGRHAILIGFGRWGTSDPRWGVPISWEQISATRVVVEAMLPDTPPQLNQGSYFFYQLLSSRVLYLSVDPEGPHVIAWDWLDNQPSVWEGRYVRQIRLPNALEVLVDGTSGRGLIRHK
ncbi:MAG: hypothetical protein GY906_37630 [bacterium]|nr:hypothetical protein [bacterium]